MEVNRLSIALVAIFLVLVLKYQVKLSREFSRFVSLLEGY